MPEATEKVHCCCFKKTKPNPEEPNVQVANVAFSQDLPQDLKPGKAICITGKALPNCPRFSVDLKCGKTPNPDIAFHLNPRLLQRYVVRNSRLNGQWGIEEKTSTVKFPFSRSGSTFLLTILIGDGEFLVAVDGVHLCTYKFRVPWAKVTSIEVQGSVDIADVEYKQLEKYPEVRESPPEVRIEGERKKETAIKPGMETPLTFLLREGLKRGFQLEIYGRVKILPHSFYVNLQEGLHKWPHPKVPLHLNPRFGTGSGEELFVRNAWIDGWGQEERTPGFQFEPGSSFAMVIRRDDDHFSVWVDGKLAGEFKFRTEVDQIDTVHIEGDVVVFDVFATQKTEAFAP